MQPHTPLKGRKRRRRARAYILLSTIKGQAEEAALIMQQNAGVVLVERIEGPPDIIGVVEALDRQELANAIMKVLSSIEAITDRVELLPVRENTVARFRRPRTSDIVTKSQEN